MKTRIRFLWMWATVWIIVLFCSFLNSDRPQYHFPYKQAGLTEEQAAAHLLSRFTYGPTPGQVEAVVKMGLENWFHQQLNANLPEKKLDTLLNKYDAMRMTNREIVNTFPRPGQIIRMAVKDGVIDKDSVRKADKKGYKEQLKAYMQEKGLKPTQELIHQFVNQKIVRASYSNNQLQEVLTEFWFNHFNVSFAKGECAQFIPAYERDVIRPNALGNFEDFLIATAKSPAMLTYLDNFSSSGTSSRQISKSKKNFDSTAQKRAAQFKRMKGLNENYAREVMELHTLGVDGGYTQADVTEAARILTGWTIYPMRDEEEGKRIKKMLDQSGKNKVQGFRHDGDFLFAPNRHDDREKTVLGNHFKGGGGYEEGVQLLKLLAHHPSTAKFISRKMAVRFVNDDPPSALINKMAKIFEEKNGDIKQLIIAIATSDEFWSNAALREKTKSPFELAISAVRSLDAQVDQPYQLFNWIDRMGQKIYYYQAPTGFPDKGQYWINTGSLLNRMNFGLALATGRIPGISLDLLALNNNHEPESTEEALQTFSKRILPGRDVEATIKRLTPLLNDPDLQKKVSRAASDVDMTRKEEMEETEEMDLIGPVASNDVVDRNPPLDNSKISKYKLSQVVGIIVGSPEFQRR
jgi:uncharacterized protein (DUF1800 family)